MYINSVFEVSTMAMNHKHLEEFLIEKGIWFRLFDKTSTVHTADASKVTGIPLEQITKSLVFLADRRPVLAVIPGDRKVDIDKLSRAISAKKITLVPFKDASKFSGYPPGGTPPIHHVNITTTVFDNELKRFNTIYGGGGSQEKMIELKLDDALKLTDGIIASISKK